MYSYYYKLLRSLCSDKKSKRCTNAREKFLNLIRLISRTVFGKVKEGVNLERIYIASFCGNRMANK